MTRNEQRISTGPAQIGDLDYVLTEVGEFRKYQIFHFILMSLPIILSIAFAMEFVVTSSSANYRCKIPSCDLPIENSNYDQPWLRDAIPYRNGQPVKCLRYNSSINSNYSTLTTTPTNEHTCPMVTFDRSQVIQCNEFVFKTNEHRVSKEFNIMCEENEYKLALIGTINNAGVLILMPLTGYLSDKFGRLKVLVFSMFGRSICGIAKGFVGSYTLFLIFEFLGATIGGGAFLFSYVLCLEWVSTRHRVRANAIVVFLGPLGETLLGLVAMYYDHYRSFLMFVNVPGLLIIFYPWLVPESARWLAATGQHDAALEILQRAAKHNNTTMSEQSYAILRKSCDGNKERKENGNSESVFDIFKHKTLIIRSIVLAFCWIIIMHSLYGLSLSSTKIAEDDNKYLSYMVIMAAELPAALISFSILDYAGRRTTLCGALFTSGVVTLASTLVPDQQTIVIRVLSFIGMCAISCSSGVLFIFSAEIWPTPLRNRMMNIFCMIGQFGSMMAPLTTLLAQYMPALPYFVFGGTAIISACICLILPETLKKKLPDTIEEARNL